MSIAQHEHGRHFGLKQSYFGADTKGHDVKAFGDTTSKYVEWDASNNKFAVAGTLFYGSTAITSSAAELNVLDGVTAGTVTASKAVVVGSTKNIDTLVIANSGLKLGSGGTAVTATAAELNVVDGVTAGTVTASKALVCGSTKNLDTLVIANSGLILGSGGTAMTKTSAQINALVGGVAAGYLVARGTQAATASAAINTGLTTIVGFSVTPYADTGTKINTAPVVSGVKSSGATLTVYRWKCATPSTATWVAATTAGTVAWTAIGT